MATEQPAAATADLDALLNNVSSWLQLQCEEAATLMAHAQSSHLEILADLDEATTALSQPLDGNEPLSPILLEKLSPASKQPPKPRDFTIPPARVPPNVPEQTREGDETLPPVTPSADRHEAVSDLLEQKEAAATSSPPSRDLQTPPAMPPRPSAVDIKARSLLKQHSTPDAATPAPFSAIETVLAARRQRLTQQQQQQQQQQPSPVAMPSLLLDGADEEAASSRKSASPPQENPQEEEGEVQQPPRNPLVVLRNALHRWHRWGIDKLECHPTDYAMGVAAAPRLARASCVRRWRATVLDATAQKAAAAAARDGVKMHAVRARWLHWRGAQTSATLVHQAAGERARAACAHAARSTLGRAIKSWGAHARRACALIAAADTALYRAACAHRRGGLRAWRQWMRRRAAWCRCAERRAEAHGGGPRQHLPCMRGFDRQAIYVEEGSHGVANAHRRRRRMAVVLCAWYSVAVGVDQGQDEGVLLDGEDRQVASDRDRASTTSEPACDDEEEEAEEQESVWV